MASSATTTTFAAAATPPGTLQVCRAEACQAMGAEALLAHARQHLGCGLHAESGDGRFTVEPAYCLGLCASSPAITVDGQAHAHDAAQAGCAGRAGAGGRMSVVTVYVPCDSAALAVGADAVANASHKAATQGLDVHIVRNGSRGLFWLEPWSKWPRRRASAYGPYGPAMCRGCSTRAWPGGAHPPPWADRRHSLPGAPARLTFARVGMTDPRSLADYRPMAV